MSDQFDAKRFAWARSVFDLEGVAGAVAAWLVGILLGMIWSGFFWLGLIAAIVILLGTRRANRTTPDVVGGVLAPDVVGGVLAPVDGIVADVAPAVPPSELRLGLDDALRVRVSSSPASQNGVFAPIDGALETLIVEPGGNSVPIAMDAEAHDLHQVFMVFETADRTVGVRLASGGLGPRVQIDHEAGDATRAGKRIGKRRLGGWCDIYLPGETAVTVLPGMTVVAGETLLVAATNDGPGRAERPEKVEALVETVAAVQELETPAGAAAGAATAAAASSVADEAAAANDAAPAPDADTPDAAPDPAPEAEDPSEMFKRLRSKVEEASKDDDPAS